MRGAHVKKRLTNLGGELSNSKAVPIVGGSDISPGKVVFSSITKKEPTISNAPTAGSFQEPIVWIAGGVDKGNDYESLVPLVSSKVRVLICMGKNNIKLHQAFQNTLVLFYQLFVLR